MKLEETAFNRARGEGRKRRARSEERRYQIRLTVTKRVERKDEK